MSSYVNFYSAQYQNMEYQYLQEAPGIINQVISSIKEEAVSFGTSHPLTNEEIHSKAFKLVRETLPKIETALKDHFKGTAYDLLIRTSMDSVSNQKKKKNGLCTK